jgi:alkanesulfonate monooxygenase SsuD/methylene tetrahydromethanopterin reductase-like flavin-dependent oxidoreductase (luciferase family)
VRYGWVLPYGDARTAAELALVAEEHGWDAFFVWEPVWGIDAWVALTAAAMRTERIRLGTMLTPLPRRLPWEVAGQVATLDNLCGGRVILAVGLGAPDDRWWLFEEDPGRRVRAERLDESLELMQRLWSGEPVTFEGEHFHARPSDFLLPPPPVQGPRPPIWVVGAWPRPRSMRRAARLDGWLPAHIPKDRGYQEMTPGALHDGVEWLRTRRRAAGLGMERYDVVAEGTTPDDPEAAAEIVRPWLEAGANWWVEADWSDMDPDRVREASLRRLTAGPPRLTGSGSSAGGGRSTTTP